MKLHIFQAVPLPIIRSSSLYAQQWYTLYRFVDSLQAGSGWNQFHPDPACKLSANRYDLYQCCEYSEKLLTMNRGTVRNMWSFIPKQNWEISASSCFYYTKYITMYGHMNVKWRKIIRHSVPLIQCFMDAKYHRTYSIMHISNYTWLYFTTS
jgi:hypothetical protein